MSKVHWKKVKQMHSIHFPEPPCTKTTNGKGSHVQNKMLDFRLPNNKMPDLFRKTLAASGSFFLRKFFERPPRYRQAPWKETTTCLDVGLLWYWTSAILNRTHGVAKTTVLRYTLLGGILPCNDFLQNLSDVICVYIYNICIYKLYIHILIFDIYI